jgi:hypothetical protein
MASPDLLWMLTKNNVRVRARPAPPRASLTAAQHVVACDAAAAARSGEAAAPEAAPAGPYAASAAGRETAAGCEPAQQQSGRRGWAAGGGEVLQPELGAAAAIRGRHQAVGLPLGWAALARALAVGAGGRRGCRPRLLPCRPIVSALAVCVRKLLLFALPTARPRRTAPFGSSREGLRTAQGEPGRRSGCEFRRRVSWMAASARVASAARVLPQPPGGDVRRGEVGWGDGGPRRGGRTDGEACGVQSSFLVKRESGRVQFSTDKYNLTSTNSFKAQGISNAKAVDISQHYADADKEKKSPKGITVSFKSGTLDKKGDWVPKSVNNPVCHRPSSRTFRAPTRTKRTPAHARVRAMEAAASLGACCRAACGRGIGARARQQVQPAGGEVSMHSGCSSVVGRWTAGPTGMVGAKTHAAEVQERVCAGSTARSVAARRGMCLRVLGVGGGEAFCSKQDSHAAGRLANGGGGWT